MSPAVHMPRPAAGGGAVSRRIDDQASGDCLDWDRWRQGRCSQPENGSLSLVPSPQLLKKNGGRGRDRTYDQSIKSRMLYQLSYASRP